MYVDVLNSCMIFNLQYITTTLMRSTDFSNYK